MKGPEKKTVEESWVKWCEEEAIPAVQTRIAEMGTVIGMRGGVGGAGGGVPGEASKKERRDVEWLGNMLAKLVILQDQLADGNAVYDGYARDEIRFKPVRVDKLAGDMVWRHGSKWLCMSASFIDANEFVESLGVERFGYGRDGTGLKWDVVSVESDFPPDRRPVVIKPVVEMTNKTKEEGWPRMAIWIEKVLAKHPGERVLIHTVSYAFAGYLHEQLRGAEGRRGKVLVYGQASERDRVLEMFKELEGSVLIGASLDRGVDLPDDLCRVVVVAKIPYPNLGDKQVNKRLYSRGGESWYTVQTLRSLVQMTGRGMRHREDWCVTYVLDAQFMKIWRKSKRLLPGWWQESVDMSGGGLM